MEQWTEFGDGDGGNNKRNFWFNFDLDFPIEKYCFDPCKEKLMSLFDQLLVSFMKEKSGSNCIRPIPALCGDGRPVDLFKLFWVVRKIGGHEAVSGKNLWGSVSKECGFGSRVISTIKSIHEKYLNELDQWLRQVASKRNLERGNGGIFRKLDLLSRELESRFMIFPSNQHREENGEFSKDISGNELHLSTVGGISEHMICKLNEACVDIDGNNNDFSASPKMVVKKAVTKRVVKTAVEKVVGNESGKSCSEDNDKKDVWGSAKKVVKKIIRKTRDLSGKIIHDEGRVGVKKSTDDMVPDRSSVGNVIDSLKRKRQSRSFSEVLNWLINVAKNPDHPSVGSLPEFSKWSEYGNEEVWVQAVLAREALLIRRHAGTNAVENLLKDKQKKARMHPSMYQDDFLDRGSMEKLRCGKRVPSSPKSQLFPCSNSNAAQRKNTVQQDVDKGNRPKASVELVLEDVDNLPKNSNSPNCLDMPSERQISVGALFQAQVPEWTGVIPKSDSKWLGTRMWSPKNDEKDPIIVGLVPIGKGRRNSCNCPFPSSVECVRFHVAEERLKLKRELGSLFYHWRFNRMGEEASLSWTEEEEQIFKAMMRSYAAFPNKFWNNASKFLPLKTRETLVSYYFNVYLVHRRSYQNRVTPKDVDSDDDEKECGSVGDYFGYRALYVPRSSIVPCTLNKESYELV